MANPMSDPAFDRRGDSPADRARAGAARRRMLRRRRRAVVLLLLIAAALVGVDRAVGLLPSAQVDTVSTAEDSPGSEPPAGAGRGVAPATPGPPAVGAAPEITITPVPPASNAVPVSPGVPTAGPGTFAYAPTGGPVLGTAGELRRFHVAVEQGTGQDAVAFAGSVDTILGDPRSWIAGRALRLQRVPEQADADFTVYLATAVTSERMCAAGGLTTERFTSCRLPGQVIINLSRWLGGVPGYGAALVVYQAYAVNHEVGHELGLGHEACPGAGQPAPVMQQQTYGLKGCTANAWPYLNGRRYLGDPVP